MDSNGPQIRTIITVIQLSYRIQIIPKCKCCLEVDSYHQVPWKHLGGCSVHPQACAPERLQTPGWRHLPADVLDTCRKVASFGNRSNCAPPRGRCASPVMFTSLHWRRGN